MPFCSHCGSQVLAEAPACGSCGTAVAQVSTPAPAAAAPSKPQPNAAAAAAALNDATKGLKENLEVLRGKISKNGAYLGVLGGFAVLLFSMFLTWSSIPTGMRAVDGGAVNGWHEKAFFAIIPFAVALYPVFLQQATRLNNVLVNIVIAFVLLGYNNVINRTSWHNVYSDSNFGSELGAGFWFGLASFVALSVCGIAWSLHTESTAPADKPAPAAAP